MLARLRSLLLKTPVLIALGLALAYLLFGWFGFEPLVKWAAPKYLADKSRHQLTIAQAEFDPLDLSVRLGGLKLNEPDGKPLLAFDELFVDFEAASLFKWAYTFDAIRLTGPHAHVALLADGRLNWSALIEAFKTEEEEEDKPLPRLLIRRIDLERGRVDVADHKVDFSTTLQPLSFALTELSTLPEDKGAYTLSTRTQLGARLRWKGDVTLKPVAANGQLAVDGLPLAKVWPYLEARLDMAPPGGVAGMALKYQVGWADKQLSLNVEDLGVTVDKLALRGHRDAAPAIALDRVALSGGRFDLARRSLDIGEVTLTGGQVDLRRDPTGRVNVQELFAPPADTGKAARAEPPPATTTSTAPPAAAGEPWRVRLARFGLDGVGLRFTDTGFITPMSWELGNLRIGFGLSAEAGAGETQLRVDGLGVDISGVRVLAQGNPKPLAVIGGLALEGGGVDLAARDFAARRLALLDGRLEGVRDAQGRIAIAEAFRRLPSKTTAAAVREEVAEAATAWKYRFDGIDLAGFQLDLRDEGARPAAKLSLIDIQASAQGFSQDLNKPLPVKLAFRVREGGRFEAAGTVVPASAEADVRLKLADLALRPAQPYLAQASNLILSDGRASTAGRVQYRKQKASYSGGFRVDDLLVNEAGTGERFLAWKTLATDELTATPSGLDIGDLRLDRLGMKLVIYRDKNTNLRNAFQMGAPANAPAAEAEAPEEETDAPAPGAAESDATPAAAPPAATAKPAAPPAFKVNIDRVRVNQGEMDFADLSLALPFGTRIHELKGGINGIGNQPGGRAQVELDGRVDDYGLARAVGELDMFDPTGYLDIKVVFQNVEMTRLTPYTATFVGRRIASGKLSLDLDYKIKQRQLLGENQIIMNKLTLGERVESPTAKNLPLDLAIAILEDSNGVIDLGLPVSGSLDDPKFSYGRIIWRAIANVLTKLVTAPFRALGKLLGVSGEALEKVSFELGDAELTPPQREKMKSLAEALLKRPGLTLTVHGTYAAEAERPVLQERRLRRQVAEKMGIKLAAGEDPGPVSTSQPKAQAALEALYAERFGAEALKTLRARHALANPEKKEQGAAGKMLSRLTGLMKEKPKPLSEAEVAELKGADLHVLIYQRLLDRTEVSDAQLAALGQARGEAVARQLTAAGVPAERVATAAPEPVEAAGREVAVKLNLGVAPKKAPADETAAPPAAALAAP